MPIFPGSPASSEIEEKTRAGESSFCRLRKFVRCDVELDLIDIYRNLPLKQGESTSQSSSY